MFYKRIIQKNFAKFRGKQLCWSLFLLKMQALVQPFLYKEILPKTWLYKFSEVFRNTVFMEHLQAAAPENGTDIVVFIMFLTKTYRSFD